MEFKIKRFNELSSAELYQLLQLRSEVFVVEQNCVYQDIDGKDQEAIHVLGFVDNELAVYARLFAPGYYFENASIGRVIVAPQFRSKNLGHELMQKAIQTVKEIYKTTAITISAQEHLEKFYNSHGFVKSSESYLEDGIPHIEMKSK